MFAIKKPNILVTWNLDTGAIIKNTILDGLNYEKFKKYSEWNGQTLLKQSKEAKIVVLLKDKSDDDSLLVDSDIKKEIKVVNEEQNDMEDSQHIYALVEI